MQKVTHAYGHAAVHMFCTSKKKRMTKRLEGHSNWYYHYKHNLLSNRHECLRNELFCNLVPSYWQETYKVQPPVDETVSFLICNVFHVCIPTNRKLWMRRGSFFFVIKQTCSAARQTAALTLKGQHCCCFFLFLTVARFSEERDANKQEFSEQDWPSVLTFNF